MDSRIETTVQGITGEITDLRHELHEHPEIRFQENWTSDRIACFLDELGVEYERGYAEGTGIIATIRGAGSKRTVALRADMDALEIQEKTGLRYASKIPGRMHACGHDGHMAILCGVAKTLIENKDLLKGTARLIFQPAEELAGGGRLMVNEGAVDGVDAVFALHGWPTIPVGKIGIRSGWLMASAQDFYITVRGKGCHGADPTAGVDPILAAAHIVTALQSVVSREINPWDAGVVTVGQIMGGTATNIIPESAELRGTLRWLDEGVGDRLRSGIERIAEQVSLAFRAQATVGFSPEPYPALYNDENAADHIRRVASECLGNEAVLEVENPCMGAEDFAYYVQKTRGAMFWLGVNSTPDSPYPQLHSPYYDFNDAALPVAMSVMSSIAIEYLGIGPD